MAGGIGGQFDPLFHEFKQPAALESRGIEFGKYFLVSLRHFWDDFDRPAALESNLER